jgi:hypothetical protein
MRTLFKLLTLFIAQFVGVFATWKAPAARYAIAL